ncbi:MAG TPA: hypothetical protein VGV37_17205 [Aliidongia sp.]|uniref:hypothetical protein n=1 Tax=Aliidongia sp. TaxID=1914230 RepID=UPI002DDCB0D7|nr:hypothetical protein [Aliidongia sp.]HEV2676266.1 hypothetical protein [Aliidongia sp.]
MRARWAAVRWSALCLTLCGAIVAEWQGLAAVPPAVDQGAPGSIGQAAPAAVARGLPLAPLEAYGAVTERPLFNQSRRPPPATVNGTAGPAPTTFSVAGILVSGRERIALLRQGNDRKLLRVREGQALGEWTVRSIAADRVALAGHGDEVTLQLHGKQVAKAGR